MCQSPRTQHDSRVKCGITDTLGLPAAIVDALADWRDVYDALDRLWLDSGPYETWARGVVRHRERGEHAGPLRAAEDRRDPSLL